MSSQLRPDFDASPFVHPGDVIDQSETSVSPFAAQLASLADKQEAAEIFVRLFADCIPTGTPYKGDRLWRAGYNRMVAIAYVVAPELFGGLLQAQVAKQLGITERQFRYLRTEIEQTFARRALTARERRARGK